jgi:amino acid permease
MSNEFLSNEELLLQINDISQAQEEENKGKSSFFGAFLLLLNTTIGSGTLLIPYCYKSGLALCVLTSFGVSLIALASLWMLIDSAKVTKGRDYSHLFEITFGKKWTWIMNVWIILVLFGTVIIYVLWIGRLVKHIVPFKAKALESPIFWNFTCAILLIFPLTTFKSLKKLESWSGVAVFFIVWLIIFALYWLIKGVHDNGFQPEKIVYFNPGKILISTFGIMSMAYDCHCNIFQTLNILKDPSTKRARWLTTVVVYVSFILYNSFGILVYLHLFDELGSGAALEYYPLGNWFTKVTILGVIIILILGGPMMVFPTRASVINLWWNGEVSTLWWNIIGASIVLLATCCACLSNNIVFFFDLVGGLLTPGFVFTMPSIFYLKNVPKQKWYNKVICAIVIIASIAATIACTYNVVTGQ